MQARYDYKARKRWELEQAQKKAMSLHHRQMERAQNRHASLQLRPTRSAWLWRRLQFSQAQHAKSAYIGQETSIAQSDTLRQMILSSACVGACKTSLVSVLQVLLRRRSVPCTQVSDGGAAG
jgi:hypothetical protein